MNHYSHIIWDWNGTLFDDRLHCLHVMNGMLKERQMPVMQQLSDYQQAFAFPISKYYQNVGFDFEKETFEQLAAEFITKYHANKTGNSPLHHNAQKILTTIQEMGIKQIILSASKQENLRLQVSEFRIAPYFAEILGIADIYAKSKIEIGLNYLKNNKTANLLLIGDTVHDYEVATRLDADCILFSKGHQNRKTLTACGVPIIDDLAELEKIIKKL